MNLFIETFVDFNCLKQLLKIRSSYEILNNFHLNPAQRINHYRNHFELTRKDLMVKNLKRYKKQIEKEGRFDEAAQ